MILSSDNPTPSPSVNTASESPVDVGKAVEKLKNGHINKDPVIVVDTVEDEEEKQEIRHSREASRGSRRNSQTFGNVSETPEYCSPCVSVVVSDILDQVTILLSSLFYLFLSFV